MNEPPPISPPAAVPPGLAYNDRSTGLMIFGVFTIILGVLCGLMVLLMVFGQIINAQNPNVPQTRFATLLPGILMYIGLMVALIWLGIGSTKARRWSRALLLIFSWSWLAIGVVSVGFMVVLFPKMVTAINDNMPAGQPKMPPEAVVTVMVVTILMLGIMFILVPAVWVFFYGSRHVKATCEARDPVPGWTDACPLPVLAMSLWLWFAVPTLVLMPVAYRGTAPFFGVFITGMLGTLFYYLMAAIWAWAAWRIYRLDMKAWWVLLVVLLLFGVSSVLTYARHDIVEMYQLMGFPESQIEQIKKTGLLAGNRMAWVTGCSIVPFLGLLLFVKKYLRPKE